MTEKEYNELLKQYKFGKVAMKFIKSSEYLMAGISLGYEYKIIKDVYSLGYLQNIDYLKLSSSKLYFIFLLIGMTGYVSSKYLEEIIDQENQDIQKDIENYQFVKKLQH